MDRLPQTLLARALYDNQADGPDELAFCRGDILTVLQQDVAGSEGWWQCLLHGRPGLAPANRLQVLPNRQTPAGRPWPPAPGAPRDSQPEHPYQVPPAGPVYEPMRGWVEGPPPPSAQVYELPDPTAPGSTPGGAQGTAWNGGDRTRVGARIVCEKTGSPAQQVLITMPRPARASLPTTLPPWGSEAPAQGWGPSGLKGQTVPPTSTASLRTGGYSSLPSPQKQEWVYDTPGPPQPARARNHLVASLAEASGPRSVPQHTPSFPSPLGTKAASHLPKTMPPGKKTSLPETSASCPAPPDAVRTGQGTGYKVPASFQLPRLEAQNTRPNVYDFPKGQEGVQQPEKVPHAAPGPSEKHLELTSAWLPRQATWPGAELDRASESGSDSRASLLSSCSSTSTDSSSSSCCEESSRELPVDLSTVKETVTALQQHVTAAVAGLLLFVSRTWRFRDHLEANIAAIRSAADHVEEALREFLDFAQGVRRMATCHLSDGALQARLTGQLQVISNSYQILLGTKGALEDAGWSLEVLATDKLQNTPDDLERFVMVARTVPEDVKSFSSMVIANGRLLFRQDGEGQETVPPKAELERSTPLLPTQGAGSPQRCTPSVQRGAVQPPELWGKNRPSTCRQMLSSLEGNEKPTLRQPEDDDSDTQRPGSVLPGLSAGKRVRLSEHCRLYFGALLKAVGVFRSGLSSGQPPEALIAQSKLVIMAGQKLVDTLCQETRDRDARNEILCGSSQLCGRLRDVALATKRAVLLHPSPDARARLQDEVTLLERHATLFRGMLE